MVAVLSGCDVATNIGPSPEKRISEAQPVRADTLQARKSLAVTFAQDQPRTADVQRELAVLHKVRAPTCAKDHSPSFIQSKDAVAERLTDQKCFDDNDRDTVECHKGGRLRHLLTAGPLRPVPSNPVDIVATTGGINQIRFAPGAPIAVCTSNKTVEVLDMGSGRSIFLDSKLSQHPFAVAIAPNGRVFAVGGTNGLSLRNSENGEMLLDLPDYQNFAWLDSDTGIAVRRKQAAVDLIDLTSNGHAVPVRGIDATPTRILPLPGDHHEFILSGFNFTARYALKRDADGLQAVLLAHMAGPPMAWSDGTGGLTPDYAWFVQASKDLWITNLKTLETQRVALDLLYPRAAGPTPNLDEVVLFPSNSTTRPMIFSISKRTFAPVEDDQLTAMPGYSAMRTVFIPSLKRVAVVTGSKIKLLHELKRGPSYGLEALSHLLTEERRTQQEKDARAVAAREGFELDRVVDGIPVARNPLLAVAQDARIEGVGVYESAQSSHGVGKPSTPGMVTVALQASAKPIVLVLSSYEPVLWTITGARSADLKAVLLSGHSQSTVVGADGIQIIQIGSHYAYQQGSSGYSALKREVVKRIGRSIETFQGRYSGTSFIIGGR